MWVTSSASNQHLKQHHNYKANTDRCCPHLHYQYTTPAYPLTFLVDSRGLVGSGETDVTHGEMSRLLQHVAVYLEQHRLCEGEVDGYVLLEHPAVL